MEELQGILGKHARIWRMKRLILVKPRLDLSFFTINVAHSTDKWTVSGRISLAHGGCPSIAKSPTSYYLDKNFIPYLSVFLIFIPYQDSIPDFIVRYFFDWSLFLINSGLIAP